MTDWTKSRYYFVLSDTSISELEL